MKKISIIIIVLNILILGTASFIFYGNVKVKSTANKITLMVMSNNVLESNESIKINSLKIVSIDNKKEKSLLISSSQNKNFNESFVLFEHILINLRVQLKNQKIKSAELINIKTKEKLKSSECVEQQFNCGILINR